MHKFLQTIALYGLATGAILAPVATQAKTYNLTVDPVVIDTGDFKRSGIGYNGASPGPVLRFKDGQPQVSFARNTVLGPFPMDHGLL
jgi:hypothetical protein